MLDGVEDCVMLGVADEVPDAAWLLDLLWLGELACEALADMLGVTDEELVHTCEGVGLPERVRDCTCESDCEGVTACVVVGGELAVEDCVPVNVPVIEGVTVRVCVPVGEPLALGVPMLDAVCVDVRLAVKVEEGV